MYVKNCDWTPSTLIVETFASQQTRKTFWIKFCELESRKIFVKKTFADEEIG